jgi:hypothetical protein
MYDCLPCISLHFNEKKEKTNTSVAYPVFDFEDCHSRVSDPLLHTATQGCSVVTCLFRVCG